VAGADPVELGPPDRVVDGIARGIAGGTIAVTTRAGGSKWALSLLFAVIELALGVILVVRPAGSVHVTAVIIGLLALFEGTHEISEAGFSRQRERRLDSTAPTRSAVTAA
jgi:uncharacterized membrane protein HdeD (DUF308 family)